MKLTEFNQGSVNRILIDTLLKLFCYNIIGRLLQAVVSRWKEKRIVRESSAEKNTLTEQKKVTKSILSHNLEKEIPGTEIGGLIVQ
jgi:formate/nitrite transporter FocA (FNT family)